jgi:hypothetical protein
VRSLPSPHILLAEGVANCMFTASVTRITCSVMRVRARYHSWSQVIVGWALGSLAAIISSRVVQAAVILLSQHPPSINVRVPILLACSVMFGWRNITNMLSQILILKRGDEKEK